jgi:hypothetical protein
MTAKPPTLKDGIAFFQNEWTGTFLGVVHLTGRIITFGEPSLEAAMRVVRVWQCAEAALAPQIKTRHCKGCNKDLPLTVEFWARRQRTGWSWRCISCVRSYAFRGLTGFMQARILKKKKQEVIDGRQQ